MHRRDVLVAVPVSLACAAGPWTAGRARAQDEVTADVVAAWVQAFYDQTRTVQARFQQHFWNRVYQRTQSSRGRLAIQRPGRIRFDYEQPAGKVLVSDGSQWILYEPGDEGGPGQYVRGSSAAASTSALGFLMGTARLTQFRRTLRAPQRTDPEHSRALELRPRRADPHFSRIVVYVDERAQSRGVVRRVSIEDPDGNWNRFDFAEMQFNRDLDAGTFRYEPPAGARELNAPARDVHVEPGPTIEG